MLSFLPFHMHYTKRQSWNFGQLFCGMTNSGNAFDITLDLNNQVCIKSTLKIKIKSALSSLFQCIRGDIHTNSNGI